MPTLLTEDGYRFFFWSLDLNEPPHVHVTGKGGKAKFWLAPVALANAKGYNERELNKIRKLVEAHAVEWLEVWNVHFGRN